MNPDLFRLLALLLALGGLVLAFLLRKRRRLIRILSDALAFSLLLFKITETIVFSSQGIFFIPYEVSHLAYYVVPLLLLSGFAGSDYAAGALAFVVGMGFLLGAFSKPDSLIYGMSLYEEIRLLWTHELLFFLALLLLFDFRRFHLFDFAMYLATMAGFALYFLLLKFRLLFPQEDFNSYSIALQVMDGSLLRYLVNDPGLGLRIFFATGCILLVFLVPFLLFFLSNWGIKEKKKKGQLRQDEVPLWGRYGFYPFLKRRKKSSLFHPSEEEQALYR
jgi:hypothetical protein